MPENKYEDILYTEPSFRYQLLSRMQSDCEYYLNFGSRYAGHLWTGNEKTQIEAMEALWDSFPESEKPEWLTREQIHAYGERMGVFPYRPEPGHARALLIPIYGAPCEISISKVDSLEEMQQLVDGLIEPVDVLGNGITLYVNDEGLFTQRPNRALYATKEMEEAGYLSQLDFSHTVKEGELYTILFGDFVAVAYDDDMELEDLSQEQVEFLTERFKDAGSGPREAALLSMARSLDAPDREIDEVSCAGADLPEVRNTMSQASDDVYRGPSSDDRTDEGR